MTGKQALYFCRNSMYEIRSLQAQADSYRQIATSATAAMSDVMVQTSRNNSRQTVLIALADKNAQISQKLAVLTEFVTKVDKLLGQIKDARKSSILRLKYIHCFSNRKIQRTLGIQQSRVSRLHQEALSEFQKIYKAKEKDQP